MASRRYWRAFKISLWAIGGMVLFGEILLRVSGFSNDSFAIVMVVAVSLAIGLMIFISVVR
jgi:hypothetical protein